MNTALTNAEATAIDEAGDRWLVGASAFFTIAVLFHNADHARRGADLLPTDVFVVGTAAIVLEAAIVILCCQRHRVAPLVAAAAGIQLAIGYVLVHFLPERSWLSDSLTSESDTSWLSWFAASLEIATATTLAAVGIAVLVRRGGIAAVPAPYLGQRSSASAVRHPLTIAMVAGNLVVLGISFAQI